MDQSNYETIVIGGGASGLAAGVSAAEAGDRVLILEALDAPGKKILASGNGRCNLMNNGEYRYYGNERFALQVMEACRRERLTAFWKRYGLFLAEEEERVYPCTFQAQSVMTALKNAIRMTGAELRCGSPVNGIRKSDGVFIVTADGKEYRGNRVILSTGGAAQVRAGGFETGYHLMTRMGHRMNPIRAALAPIITEKKAISGLAGIRVRCRVTLKSGDTVIHRTEGELMFTEYGVSGICAMQMARWAETEGCELEIHFLHRYFERPEEALPELERRQREFAGQTAECLTTGMVVPKVAYAICKQAGLAMRGETVETLTGEQIRRVAEAACSYRIPVTGTKGLENAQVTAGGIDADEFRPETMESRLVQGLHATGEVLDVDGDCGGYNLMFAFATGILAGRNGRSDAGRAG